MKTFMKRLGFTLMTFLAGAAVMSVIQAAMTEAGKRTGGTFGGEVLILPLIVLVFIIGVSVGKSWFESVKAKAIYKCGFRRALSINANKYTEDKNYEQMDRQRDGRA